jgi:hypothetical protein
MRMSQVFRTAFKTRPAERGKTTLKLAGRSHSRLDMLAGPRRSLALALDFHRALAGTARAARHVPFHVGDPVSPSRVERHDGLSDDP